jgi:hypothetical protein
MPAPGQDNAAAAVACEPAMPLGPAHRPTEACPCACVPAGSGCSNINGLLLCELHTQLSVCTCVVSFSCWLQHRNRCKMGYVEVDAWARFV